MIEFIDEQGGGRLRLLDESTGQEQGFLSYALSADMADAQHTVVHEAYQGQGLAAVLAKAFFAHAEAKGWKVRPSCSYIARYMERHPELEHLHA